MSKYILQYGSLAGWPYRVAAGLRTAGLTSINVIPENVDVEDLDRQLPHDCAISRKSVPKPQKILNRGLFLLEAARKSSLVHYHGGVILRSEFHPWLEGNLFQKMGVPMLMSFGGGDARIISEARASNPYFYLKPDEKRDARTRRYLRSISKRIRYVATDCEMIPYVEPYFEKCFIFRQPVDLDDIGFNEPTTDHPPVFLHVPTHPWAKGTDFITAAAERLKAEGYQFEFRMKRQLTQSLMHREIADCDVYIDELRCGSHGVTAVEAMAAGKPTMTFIRPDLIPLYPSDMPLVNSNPDTIYDRMKELICEPELRRALSYSSRKYAEKYHDVHVVVKDLLAIYHEIGLRR